MGMLLMLGVGWVYLVLFCMGDMWVVISEMGFGCGYCGMWLWLELLDGEYMVGFLDEWENCDGGVVKLELVLLWYMLWWVIVIGDMVIVIELMFGVDLVLVMKLFLKEEKVKIELGKVVWSWLLMGDDKINYEV